MGILYIVILSALFTEFINWLVGESLVENAGGVNLGEHYEEFHGKNIKILLRTFVQLESTF